MDFGELLREAQRAIRAHAMRSALTLLGIVIGVATLVGVISVINGLNIYVRERVFQLAPDVFVLTKFGILRSREEFLEALKRKNVEFSDFEKLRGLLQEAEYVAAEAVGTTAVKNGDHRLGDIQIHGTSAVYGPMVRLDMEAGRYFTDAEDQAAMALVVIGADVKDELYPQLDPIGHTMLVGGAPYRIVGLLAKQGRTLGQSRDAQVFIPIQAYRRQFGSRDSLNVLVQSHTLEGLDASVDEARSVMRALRHTSFNGPDPFGVVTAEMLQDLWRQISAAAFILSLLIASVSLGIGGIVIMNIMLVAVVERTREIGVRLAMGARKRDIRRQFLIESALLSLAGGFIGVAVGSLAALAVRGVLNFPATPTLPIVSMGLGLSVAVGVAAGYWPARSASNLAVVDALRTD
jgi:putative ABC transport system permease protein